VYGTAAGFYKSSAASKVLQEIRRILGIFKKIKSLSYFHFILFSAQKQQIRLEWIILLLCFRQNILAEKTLLAGYPAAVSVLHSGCEAASRLQERRQHSPAFDIILLKLCISDTLYAESKLRAPARCFLVEDNTTMQKHWWQTVTAYQIYPKSFLDTNGDGIGDLQGVIRKLDYLKDLGIGLVWLSPIYASPLADQGYDISDYYKIDPRFGTMADFEELLAEAKKRGIRIIMDLVVNHCSDEHEWFRKACENPGGPYGKYFYIEDYDGTHLPSNWRSYFGGSVWEPLPGHPDKVYLHSFHRKQPDLNWENPALREEIYRMMNWWLDKGVAGFRIDAIINIKKALPFCDYPADRDDGMCSVPAMLAHAHGIGEFLSEMQRRTFAPHDAFSVGEVFDSRPEELAAFIGENGYFSSMFDFSPVLCGRDRRGWYACEPNVSGEEYKQSCFHSQKAAAGIGFLSNIVENHDGPRGVSHYLPAGEISEAAKKMLGGLSMMLHGIPFLYEGQELGMENTVFPAISAVDDVSTIDEYHVALQAGLAPDDALRAVAPFSRDNGRTPVQWTGGAHAGFTMGTPWLPVNPNYPRVNAEDQLARPDSVRSFYKRMIALRSDPAYADTLVYGDCTPWLPEQKNLMAYLRRSESRTLLVLGNYQLEPQAAALPGKATVLLTNDLPVSLQGGSIELAGWQFVILELDV
jgi:oligo-1,6-glucosidase